MTAREMIKLINTPHQYHLDELEDIPPLSPGMEEEYPIHGEESLDTCPLEPVEGWPEEMDEENTQAYLMEDFHLQCRNG